MCDIPSFCEVNFFSKTFVSDNANRITDYAMFRIHGDSRSAAAQKAFGAHPSICNETIFSVVENTKYFKDEFSRILDETPISELWSEKKAISNLLGIVNSTCRDVKEKDRVGAIVELNILAGIRE
ncbi:hypothetical protein JX85_23690 [Salmonella enterica]|nr:hypothetical protein [Salmonella enterica]